MRLFADYHTHTVHSHGTGTIQQNIEVARKKGLRRLAITDHGPANPWLGIKRPEVLLDMKAQIKYYNQRYSDIEILLGVEANVVGGDGTIDIPRRIVRELDVLLVGLHRWVRPSDWRGAVNMYVYQPLGMLPGGRRWLRRVRVYNTKMLVEAVYRYDVDIVTHPGLNMAVDTRELARACASRGTALEINAAHGASLVDFAAAAAAEGVNFAINSDAHRPDDVGNFAAGLQVAGALCLPAERIINAQKQEYSY